VEQTTSSSINSPTIQQRKFESTVVLQNGGLVALGGLISSTKNKTRAGIPIVMNLPFIGNLFQTTTVNSTRTELIVLLTARIVRDDAAAARTVTDMTSKMPDVVTHGLVPEAPRP